MLSVNIYWYRYRLIQSCHAYKLSATRNQHNPSKHNTKSPSNSVHKALSTTRFALPGFIMMPSSMGLCACVWCVFGVCVCVLLGAYADSAASCSQLNLYQISGRQASQGGGNVAGEARLTASFGKHFSNFCVTNTQQIFCQPSVFGWQKSNTNLPTPKSASTHQHTHTHTPKHTQQSLGKLYLCVLFFWERRNKCKSHREKSFLICRNYYQSVIFDMSVGRKLPESLPLFPPSPSYCLGKKVQIINFLPYAFIINKLD